ncbi:MAG: GAF domain-containing protein [Actinomycetota bacterium]|nr:GAF domain-containing protein [Actinomycetota bacterium]
MNDHDRSLLSRIAQLASDLGPALQPTGHIELLRTITEAAKELFQAAACSVALLTDDDRELVYQVATGAGAEDVEGMRMPSSQGIAGWVVTSGQPMAIEDTAEDARFARQVAESTGYVPKTLLVMPLETERRMIGAITVLDRQGHPAGTGKDMELLAIFARQAALAIENSKAFTDLGHSLFEAVARAADADDISRALDEIAQETRGEHAQIAELAGHFHEISQAGDAEQEAAVRLLREFARYLSVRKRRR